MFNEVKAAVGRTEALYLSLRNDHQVSCFVRTHVERYSLAYARGWRAFASICDVLQLCSVHSA